MPTTVIINAITKTGVNIAVINPTKIVMPGFLIADNDASLNIVGN